jgi:hypothetical protein
MLETTLMSNMANSTMIDFNFVAKIRRNITVLYIHVIVQRNKFLFNNQPDALIIQIYSVIKLYMIRASSLPIIRSFLLYIPHW